MGVVGQRGEWDTVVSGVVSCLMGESDWRIGGVVEDSQWGLPRPRSGDPQICPYFAKHLEPNLYMTTMYSAANAIRGTGN